MDLFAAATENGPSLESAFKEALSGRAEQERASLSGFSERVERDGRVSINARGAELLAFLKAGQYKNIHQLAKEESGRLGRKPEEILRERLGRYYERRLIFDRHFEHGEQFQYGALSIGGQL